MGTGWALAGLAGWWESSPRTVRRALRPARGGHAHGRLRRARGLVAVRAHELPGHPALRVREVPDGQHHQLRLRRKNREKKPIPAVRED